MKKTSFNEAWKFKVIGNDDTERLINLPHDAMLEEERKEGNPSGTNAAWFKGSDYEYTKTFEEIKGKRVVLEFEGVYHNAEIYLNDEKIYERPYGYTNFYVDITDKQRKNNTLKVIAKNSDQPNSRWYSGAGIYRPVNLYTSEKSKYIEINGILIKPTSKNSQHASIKTSEDGKVSVKVLDPNNNLVFEKEFNTKGELEFDFTVKGALPWNIDTPNLYKMEVYFGDDFECQRFGFRTITCNPKDGFKINGERVTLRGCCIHSDNGILGSKVYYDAEYRKVKKLKEAGYNAIRSAHNPESKAFLDACDEIGMFVMDEYVDMWYVHKTMYDYASYVSDWYKEDLKDMCLKDYNHPSVIMYSLGNEVGESSEEKGINLFKDMKQVLYDLDGTRPVTAGINIMFNMMYSLGFGIYSEEKAKKNQAQKVGSEFFNDIAGLVGNHTMKIGATMHRCDVKTREIFKASDIAGYNYGILRVKKDLKKYPDRLIIGSETFCEDAYKFIELAKDNERFIGDFVWAGIDYLGEVGIGSWEYKEYAPDFRHGEGWISAGSGRLDLIGNELGEALYTKVAFNLSDKPEIAVVPVSYTKEKHSPSAWKMSNAIPSWSFDDLDGSPARVEVYSRSKYVKLVINGKDVGIKKTKNAVARFNTKYYHGKIMAIALDDNKREINRNTLVSASLDTKLSLIKEKESVKLNNLQFVRIEYTDSNGIFKPLKRGRVDVSVEGATLIALGHACPFNADGYLNNYTDTYYGRALAIIKCDNQGEVRVNASSPFGDDSITFNVE